MPTFSVIIPTYQGARTIVESVASALEQTRPAFEVIVCDDGSTDDTATALEPFRDRITYLRQENAGAAAARNRGVQAASGEFVTTLDSDDVWLPRYLEALGELAAARPDLDLLSTDVYFDVDGELVGRFYAENEFAVEGQRQAILAGCFVGWPAARRTRLVSVGGFDESLTVTHDWDAWLRLILDGSRAGLVDEPLRRYRLRAGSLTANRARLLRERVIVLDKARERANLGPEELDALEAARRMELSRARLAEVREGFLERRPGARRRALAMSLERGLSTRTRLRIIADALAGSIRRRKPDASEPGERVAHPKTLDADGEHPHTNRLS